MRKQRVECSTEPETVPTCAFAGHYKTLGPAKAFLSTSAFHAPGNVFEIVRTFHLKFFYLIREKPLQAIIVSIVFK